MTRYKVPKIDRSIEVAGKLRVDGSTMGCWAVLNIFGIFVSKPRLFVQSFVGAVLDGSASPDFPCFIRALGR